MPRCAILPTGRPGAVGSTPTANGCWRGTRWKGGLADFVRAGEYLLRHRGRMCLVYPSERAVELFAVMRQYGLEPRRVRFVHSFADAPATLVLAEGIKGARTSLTVLPPLVIYRGEDEYTDETAELLAG